MKRYAALIFLAATASALAADPSIAGKWDVATSIAGNDGLSVCTFVQKDAALTGSCKGDDGVDHPLTGKLEGNKVTWEYKSEYNGQPLTIGFSGTVNSEKQFAGTVDVEPMGVNGDFTAKRKP
jgi:hypothetical protein